MGSKWRGKSMPYSTVDVAFKVKASDVEDDGKFKGIASPFWGEPDSYGDIIVSGAYKDTILEGGRNKTGIALLYQHDHTKPLGIWLELIEKDDGLHVVGKINLETQLGRETHSNMKMGAIQGLSIGFDLPTLKNGDIDPDSFDQVFDKKTERWITYYKKLVLWEVSVVTFPAATSAIITTVKDFHRCETERDWEKVLRDSGLSKAQAQHLVKLIKPSLRESGATGKSNKVDKPVVVGSKDLSPNDRDKWDDKAAKKRMLEWSGGKENFDPEKFKMGFVILDGKEDDINSYKFPFADVVDGKLIATWGGVKNAMEEILSSNSIATDDLAYDFLVCYYEKFGHEVPIHDKSVEAEEMEILKAFKKRANN